MKKFILAAIISLACSVCAFAWSVDFDGDGTSDASGSAINVVVPPPTAVDDSSSGNSSVATTDSSPDYTVTSDSSSVVDEGIMHQQEGEQAAAEYNANSTDPNSTAAGKPESVSNWKE